MKNAERTEKMKVRPTIRLSALISLVLLGIGLFFLFVAVDGWAVTTFARHILAAALIAAIDVVLFFLAIALAPSLSWLIGLVLNR